MKTILTIAGLDPSNGAGITKDLDVFASLGIHGLSIPTCIVSQGPTGVFDIYPVAYPKFIEMLDAIKDGIWIDGIKTGVLINEAYVDRIKDFIKCIGKVPFVIDPIIKAKDATILLSEEGIRHMLEALFPLASLVTPNIDEAAVLTGLEIDGVDGMKEAVKRICDRGVKAVVIKGGHLNGPAIDLLYDGGGFLTYERPRLERNVHGTGCIFSSLMASFLVSGYRVREAFLEAEEIMTSLLTGSYRIDRDGSGYFYTSSSIEAARKADRWQVISKMEEAASRLLRLNPIELIPEVQMNIGYAIKAARGIEDVAAFPGRIGHHNGRVLIKAHPSFGASSHVARIILTSMRFYPHIRACASIRYQEETIERAKGIGMHVLFYDRKREPKDIMDIEGKSLDFMVDAALKETSEPPDIIYDKGAEAKEPIIRLFADDPLKLIEKMEALS